MANLQLAGTAQPPPSPASNRPDSLSLSPGKSAKPAGEIMVNGELIARDDVDALADGLRWVAKMKDRFRPVEMAEAQIRQAIDQLASGDNKTQRLVGEAGSVIHVTKASDGWDGAKLLAIWEQFPELRDKCLKINTIGVKAREWAKLLTVTNPPPELGTFIELMKSAVRPATALPTVKVEEPGAGAIDVAAGPVTPVTPIAPPAASEIDVSDL